MSNIKEILETRQISIYFFAVILAVITAIWVPQTTSLEIMINPALAFMLFVTFLQVPLMEIGHAFRQVRFLSAILLGNFLVIPILIFSFMPFFPKDIMAQLGILLVLLTPCIDYVVTFAALGRANARLLLAATPLLLIMQIILLPIYLEIFFEKTAGDIIQLEPFLHAFVWLIAMPLLLAGGIQFWQKKHTSGVFVFHKFALLPVPATAIVLFIVIAAVIPRLDSATDVALQVVPIYIAFAIIAPLIGWGISQLFRLDAPTGRTIAFSAGTRNSLVILPLTFAIPGAIPILPTIIVTQTLIEMVTMLIYVKFIPKLGK